MPGSPESADDKRAFKATTTELAAATEASSEKRSKAKVMIYVPPDLHRAVRMRAVDARRSTSEIYEAAAREFLNRVDEVPEVGKRPVGAGQSGPSSLDQVAHLLELQGRRLDEIATVLSTWPLGKSVGGSDHEAKNGGYAAAAEHLLRLVRDAGLQGVVAHDLDWAMRRSGFDFKTTNVVKTTLHAGGLLRYAVRRWYLTQNARVPTATGETSTQPTVDIDSASGGDTAT